MSEEGRHPYERLHDILMLAYVQASEGKGKERHAAEGEPFEKQIICEVTRRLGTGYPLGQAVKKVYESQRLGGERGVAELLGAINYIAAAVIVMREVRVSEEDARAQELSARAQELDAREAIMRASGVIKLK